MPRISFSRVFQLSACLMACLLSMKIYLLANAALFSGEGNATTSLVAVAKAGGTPADTASKEVPSAASATPPAPVTGAGKQETEKQGAADKPVAAITPCSDGGTCVGQVSKPELDLNHRADDQRQALLTDLAGRTQQLDEESRRLAEMKKTIEASQAVLDTRLQKYSEDRSAIAAEAARKQELGDADIDKLVKIYEAMPPRDAASIFDVLDFQVVVPVMSRMNPRKASAVLANMSPEKAMTATQLLAGLPRKRGTAK